VRIIANSQKRNAVCEEITTVVPADVGVFVTYSVARLEGLF